MRIEKLKIISVIKKLELAAVATVHVGSSVHCNSDSEDWNGIQ